MQALKGKTQIKEDVGWIHFWLLIFFLFFFLGSSNHNSANSAEEVSRGVAVEKLDSVKKWGINTYKVLCTFSLKYLHLYCHIFVYGREILILLCIIFWYVRFNTVSVYTHYAVHEADVLREVWTRLTNSRPGAGGADRSVKRHEKQV